MIRQEDIQIKVIGTVADDGLSASSTEYREHHFPKHFHDHYTILFVEDGVNEGFTERTKYKVGKGQILVINPGELHAGNSFQNNYLRFSSLRITQTFLHHLCRQNGFAKKGDIMFANQPIADQNLAHLMSILIRNIGRKSNPEVLASDYTSFLFPLMERYSNQDNALKFSLANRQAVQKAYSFIRSNYQEGITLDDIASHAHLSRYHLIRAFKKEYGLSPFQYLRNLRIEEAKKLFSTPYSITQIAMEVGFFDHSHFLRNFKKIEGTLPSNLRKSGIS